MINNRFQHKTVNWSEKERACYSGWYGKHKYTIILGTIDLDHSLKINMVTRVFLTPTKSYWTCFAIPTAANIMNMSNATTAVEMMVRAGHGASDQVRSCMKHIVTHQKENGAIMPGAAHHPNTHTFGKSRPVRNSTSSTRTFQPVK